MGGHSPVKPDKKQVQDAQSLWTDFNKLMFYCIYAVVGVVLLLGLFFVDWT